MPQGSEACLGQGSRPRVTSVPTPSVRVRSLVRANLDDATVDLIVGLSQAFAWPVAVVALVALLRRPLLGLLESLRGRPFDVSAGPLAIRVEGAAAALESAMVRTGQAPNSTAVRAALPPEDGLVRLQGRRLLWVDDHPGRNRDEIRVFELLGIVVHVARSTEEAMHELDRTIVDAVVTDMVRGDDPSAGLGLIDTLRQRGITLPVFIYVTDFDAERGVPEGAAGITNRADLLVSQVVTALSA